MNNLINFPTKAEYDWKKVEPSIRKVLQETNASTEMQNDILKKMAEAYEKYNAQFNVKMALKLPEKTTASERENISDSLKQTFNHLQTQVQDLMQEILLDRLLLEIQLYNARKTSQQNV